jgi:hypothetical protein
LTIITKACDTNLPELKQYDGIIQVIDVPLAAGGATVQVVTDLHTRHALCFLERGSSNIK